MILNIIKKHIFYSCLHLLFKNNLRIQISLKNLKFINLCLDFLIFLKTPPWESYFSWILSAHILLVPLHTPFNATSHPHFQGAIIRFISEHRFQGDRYSRDYGYLDVQEYFDPYDKIVVVPTDMDQECPPPAPGQGRWTQFYSRFTDWVWDQGFRAFFNKHSIFDINGNLT